MSIYNSKPIVSDIIEFSVEYCDNAFAILINGNLEFFSSGQDQTSPIIKSFDLRPGINIVAIVFANFGGRVTFKYTIRDRNGDIETVNLDPKNEEQGIYRSDAWEIYTPFENS